jgi:glucan 1,3-beta-glucosidase
VRNFVIDLTGGPEAEQTGFHWQVSQSTSLMNIRIEMGKGSNHRGMFMEVSCLAFGTELSILPARD